MGKKQNKKQKQKKRPKATDSQLLDKIKEIFINHEVYIHIILEWNLMTHLKYSISEEINLPV